MDNKMLLNQLDKFMKMLKGLYLKELKSREDNPIYYLGSTKFFSSCIELLDEKETITLLKLLERIFLSKYNLDAKNSHYSWYITTLENFFRKSGFTLEFFKNRKTDDEYFKRIFLEEIYKKNIEIDHYAPLQLLSLPIKKIEFENFDLMKYNDEDLGSRCNNEINTAFYPQGLLEKEKLEKLWFIHAKENIVPNHPIFIDTSNLEDAFMLSYKLTNLPHPIENALKAICLYNWEEILHKSKGLELLDSPTAFISGNKGLEMPFIISIHDSLFFAPYSLKGLQYDQISGLEMLLNSSPVFQPNYNIELDINEAKIFELFIRIQEVMITIVNRIPNLQFLDNALSSIVKANFSKGLEKLLWHIIAIEAVVGDTKDGFTSLVSQRVARILGKNERSRKKIKEHLRNLYELRSHIVHGRRIKPTWASNLVISGYLARTVTLWFLNYVGQYIKEYEDKLQFDRSHFLSIIDMNSNDRVLVQKLLSDIPNRFPYVKEWIEI